MRFSKVTAIGIGAGAATFVAVSSLPVDNVDTPNMASDLAIRAPDSGTTTELDIRASGNVALYQRDEKTVIYTRQLVASTIKSVVGCAAGVAIGGPPGAFVCVAALALGTVDSMVGMAAIQGKEAAELAKLKVPGPTGSRSIEADLNHPNNLEHYFPPTNTSTTMDQLKELYNGIEILISHSHCQGPGCHEFWYSNSGSNTTQANNGTQTIHRISRKPRRAPEKAEKRDGPNIPGDHFPKTADAGPGADVVDNIYATYSYWDIHPVETVGDVKSSEMTTEIEKNLENIPALGLICMNIHDQGAAGLKDEQATAGVFSFQLGSVYGFGGPLSDGTPVAYDEQGAIGACQKEQ